MSKVLKNYQDNNQVKMAIQSKTICKRSEKQRIFANKRERDRTRSMKNMFEKLSTKFKPSATKQEILTLSKKYVEFLYLVSMLI